MDDLRPLLLPKIMTRRFASIPAGAVHPNYEDASLLNLPASICRWLDVPPFGAPPLAAQITGHWGRPFRHVILVLVDGLGLEQLQRAWAAEEAGPGPRDLTAILTDALLAPLTSIAPSTTAAALTSLWTGLPAAGHGNVGYEMWLKEYGMIVNAITHSAMSYTGDPGGLRRAGFTPETFLPVPTLGPHLVAHGVQVNGYQHVSISRSTLSTMLLPGARPRSYRGLGDLFVTLSQDLAETGDKPSYSYVYWGELDELMHRYGPQDERVELELAAFSRLLNRFITWLRQDGPGSTLTLLCADHGQITTPFDPRYELRRHPELMDCLVMNPCGESRLAYLYLRPGREEAACQYIQHAWPGEFALLSSAQALDVGLLGGGPRHPRIQDRLGDLVAIATGPAHWWWGTQEDPLRGRHGGLSAEEMLIPLAALSV